MTELQEMVLPTLSNQPNVELAQTGTWKISTGEVTLQVEDFSNAIAALECPAVHRPIIKIGHTDPRFDGEPGVGFIDNMALRDSGHTISGDYVGMPGWLGPILSSAYPSRSMEATWDFVCQLGHVHPFVITAVALLGVTPPGIGTLTSLQDVASLYGYAMAASQPDPGGFSVSIQAKGAEPMPNPRSREIAAGITAEDVRRTFYESAASPTTWIKEMSIDPLQLITVDDATGEFARVPLTISGDEVEFGDPVPVTVVYQDNPAPKQSAASADRLVYASRAESRPSTQETTQSPAPKVETKLPPAQAIKRVHAAAVNTKEGPDMDLEKIREALGLSADASEDDVLAAATALRGASASATPIPPTQAAPQGQAPVAASGKGIVVLDESVVAQMREMAERGDAAYKEMQRNRRDGKIAAAIEKGKFAPSRKEYWEKLWDADPEGTEAQIDGLSPNLIPLRASGHRGATETAEADQQYYEMFPDSAPRKAV